MVCNNKGKRFGSKIRRKAERATSSDVFNIIQKRPNTVVHLKVDEALEGRRSHKEMKSR